MLSIMSKSAAQHLILGFIVFLITSLNSAYAEDKNPSRTISLSGAASVQVKPDIAQIFSGVETVAKTAKEAVSKNSEQMQKIIAALKTGGINEEDMQTTNFSVQPQYENYKNRNSKGSQTPKIIGYRVNNTLLLTLRDLSNLGTILDKTVSLGSNRISNIRFDVDKPEQYLDKMREKAMANALTKAKLYTKAAGTKLGNVISISENYSALYRGVSRNRSFTTEQQSVPVAPGSKNLEIQIAVTWELED